MTRYQEVLQEINDLLAMSGPDILRCRLSNDESSRHLNVWGRQETLQEVSCARTRIHGPFSRKSFKSVIADLTQVVRRLEAINGREFENEISVEFSGALLWLQNVIRLTHILMTADEEERQRITERVS